MSESKKKDTSGQKSRSRSESADLADVVGDSAVVGDVESILDCVVAALGELEGLFVTELKA